MIHRAQAADETLAMLQWLPQHQDRVAGDDLAVLRRFFAYVQASAWAAAAEEQETGRLSPESERRWERIRTGLDAILAQQDRRNELRYERHTYNHAAWRDMFHQMAVGLSRIDFVPLREAT